MHSRSTWSTIIVAFTAVVIAVSCPSPSRASVGVGIGTGKIVIQQPLRPGSIYTLPAIPVLNTGDEPSEYGISIEHQQDQPQLVPSSDWFMFRPATFQLAPQQSQVISVTLSLPIKMRPGDYFAYIEAHPVMKDVAGQARIGVAAATKLYFSVAPANALQGLFYAVAARWVRLGSWPYLVLIVLAAGACVVIFRRYFHLSVRVK